MDQAEQTLAFVSEIQKVVDRFRQEFDITNATAIGCLEIVKLSIFQELVSSDEQ